MEKGKMDGFRNSGDGLGEKGRTTEGEEESEVERCRRRERGRESERQEERGERGERGKSGERGRESEREGESKSGREGGNDCKQEVEGSRVQVREKNIQ